MQRYGNAKTPSGKDASRTEVASRLAVGHPLVDPVPAAVELSSLGAFASLRLCVELGVSGYG